MSSRSVATAADFCCVLVAPLLRRVGCVCQCSILPHVCKKDQSFTLRARCRGTSFLSFSDLPCVLLLSPSCPLRRPGVLLAVQSALLDATLSAHPALHAVRQAL